MKLLKKVMVSKRSLTTLLTKLQLLKVPMVLRDSSEETVEGRTKSKFYVSSDSGSNGGAESKIAPGYLNNFLANCWQGT